MRYPVKIKNKAIQLRKRGYSLNEISKKMKISKSTASLWLRKVKLNKNAKKRLKERGIYGQYKTSLIFAEKRRKRKLFYKSWALKSLSSIKLSKTMKQIICAVLYWAEGGKFSDNHLAFTNSDPVMLRAFIQLLDEGFNADKSKYRANIHLHEYHNNNKQKQYWASVTGLKTTQFNKSYLKPHTGIRKKENYPGCVRICYYDADIARKIKALYENLIDFL